MKELIKSISKKEWQFVILMSLAMIIITGLPYFFGWLMAPKDSIYTGIHALSPSDIPVYYSYINQVKNGHILVKDLFTSELQFWGTFNIWWSLVGFLAWFLNLSPVIAFQLSRLLAIPIFMISAYIFLSYFLDQKILRKLAIMFLSFASGVGVYFASWFEKLGWGNEIPYRWPIDLWLVEANAFNLLYQTSHFIISITLTLVIFLLMIFAFKENKVSYAVISGFLALFYFNFHPYYWPVIFGVLGIYLFILILKAKKILWRQIFYLIIVFLVSLPAIIYHIWLIKNSPVLGFRALQNITSIPAPVFVILGYGFLLPGFLLGLFFAIKNKLWNDKFTFLTTWLLFNIFLVYSPLPFQSRYTQGLNFILIIFTVLGLFHFYQYLKIKIPPKLFNFWINNPALLIFLFFILFCTSTFFNLTRDIYYFIIQPNEVKKIFYLSNQTEEAINWFNIQPKGKVILASDIPAKFIPGFSGQSVYIGHSHETLFYEAKIAMLAWFFTDNKKELDSAKKSFLLKNKIDYIFFSSYEKELGDFNPVRKDYLKLVFELPEVKIYQVIKE